MKLICLNCLHSFDEADHLRCPKCKSDKIQEMPAIFIVPSDNEFIEYDGRKFFTDQIEYWKKRCELAEKVILLHDNCDPSYSEKLSIEKSFDEWQDFKNSAKNPLKQDEEREYKNQITLIAGVMKFAIDNDRIVGDHDFNADVAGPIDSFEQIAKDYLKGIRIIKYEERWQD